MNRIYLLKRTGKSGYDQAVGFVVIAKSAAAARKHVTTPAPDGAADEYERAPSDDYAVWLDPKKSSCRVLRPTGRSRVVLRDFNAA